MKIIPIAMTIGHAYNFSLLTLLYYHTTQGRDVGIKQIYLKRKVRLTAYTAHTPISAPKMISVG